jgi:dTDP-4-dehydrorhamnose 3,5-epimerase
MLWVPQGFAHGFLVLSAEADVLYKTTSFYDAPSEHCLRWDDPALGISWPLSSPPLLSAKDQRGCFLNEAALFP